MITRVNHLFLIIFIIISIKLASAQEDDHEQQHPPTSSNFQPSLFVVIGVLSFMFSLTSILLIYARFFYRQPSAIHSISRNQDTNNAAMFGNDTRFSGIDKKVVDSLPFFKFSSLKGAKQGLQCAVCLAEFEDVEVLRLLPKCKHGFHIECVDLWLEHHSTCPLCRQTVSAEDLTTFNTSSSMRFITNGGGERQKSDVGDAAAVGTAAASSASVELFLDRENSVERCSRFSSFRRVFSTKVEDEVVQIQVNGKVLNRLNHQIVVSDVVFKHRWSDVSSSDLMFLNSKMLGVMSSDRITCSSNNSNDDDAEYGIINIRDEIGRKKNFEDRVEQIKGCNSKEGFEELNETNMNSNHTRRNSLILPGDKRSMSEITALSRFKEMMSMKNKLGQCLTDNNSDNCNINDDDLIKRRKKWFPIAKKQFNGLQIEKKTSLSNRSNPREHVKHRINQLTNQSHKLGRLHKSNISIIQTQFFH